MSVFPDDELLRLWAENDRFQYSAETFEAVRSILAGRGIKPPPQGDPPPFATHAPAHHPAGVLADDQHDPAWVTWIRPILWLGVAVGVAKLLSWVATCRQYLEMYDQGRLSWTDWRLGMMVGDLALTLSLPCCLLAGVWAALRKRPAARRILFAYVVAALALRGIRLAVTLYAVSRSSYGMTAEYLLQQADNLLEPSVYPLVLLILLRRPEVYSLPAATPAGFEVPTAHGAKEHSG
jgi:hypothetical protein